MADESLQFVVERDWGNPEVEGGIKGVNEVLEEVSDRRREVIEEIAESLMGQEPDLAMVEEMMEEVEATTVEAQQLANEALKSC